MRFGEPKRMVWKVDSEGHVIEELGLTDAGRKLIFALPEGHHLREQWIWQGRYELVLKGVLDKCRMVNDELQEVARDGYYWMYQPPQAMVNRINMFRRVRMTLRRENEMLRKQVAMLTAERNKPRTQICVKCAKLRVQHSKRSIPHKCATARGST